MKKKVEQIFAESIEVKQETLKKNLALIIRAAEVIIGAFKSGHKLNRELLKKIAQQKEKYGSARQISRVEYKPGSSLDVRGIMNVIPHRYPFLLVDRILQIESGKRAVAIKNVTANEAFFQGHFPARPVMPGVLMVEAMAQVAGVIVLSNPDLAGKLAFFMSVDAVKFR